MQVLQAQTDFSHVLNGRFKGGHITRHYGEPALGRHAVQLEMACTCYMDEKPPYRIAPDRARQVLPVLRRLVQTLIDWRPQ
jgi:N-formylglutamate deformylase